MANSEVTTESGGRQNMFPSETVHIDESVSYDGYPQNAEKVNGRYNDRFCCIARRLCNNRTNNSRYFLMSLLTGFLIFIVSLTALFIIFSTKQFQEENISYLSNNKLKNTSSISKNIEKEKVIDETLNGRFAMIGLIVLKPI